MDITLLMLNTLGMLKATQEQVVKYEVEHSRPLIYGEERHKISTDSQELWMTSMYG